MQAHTPPPLRLRVLPHPPHSMDHLLTVPHLHFNRGGSQTSIPSSFMSLDCFSILPHAPQPTGKSRERGIPPLLLPHLPYLSVGHSEMDSPGRETPIHLLWHSLVWQRRNFPPLPPEMLSIPFYRCHIITLPSCPPHFIPIHSGCLGTCSQLALGFFYPLNMMESSPEPYLSIQGM